MTTENEQATSTGPRLPSHVTERDRRFVEYVTNLLAIDTGMRASARKAYRRSVDDPVAIPITKFVARWLPEDPSYGDRVAAYATVALMSQHFGKPTATGASVGRAVRNAVGVRVSEGSTARLRVPDNDRLALRVERLGPVRLAELSETHLPKILDLVASKGASMPCMATLHADLRLWDRSSGRVAIRWVNDLYR